MKVLHITNNYPTLKYPIFGIFVKEQIDSLSQTYAECDTFFINGKEKGKAEYFRSIIKLKRVLKSGNYDLVHCHHVFSAIIYIMTGFSEKIPSVISFQNDPNHESVFNLFKIVKHFTTFWIFKNNSKYVDNLKGYYLPNGVNTDFFKPIDRLEACKKIGIDTTKKYVLFVSSNQIRKQKRYDRFQYVISELKKWDEDIEELKMINIERNLVPYYFNAASLHLLTSDFEGSPNSVKEAMCCNTPVVSTNVGNVKELLENVYASYCDTSNADSKLIELCKKSLSQNESSAHNSRIKIFELGYDILSVAKKLENIYSKSNKSI
jgi:glycosyltransferase involved in cell wall biosynthesis